MAQDHPTRESVTSVSNYRKMENHFLKCVKCFSDTDPNLNKTIHGANFTGTGVSCPICRMELRSDVIVTECGHLHCVECWVGYSIFGYGSIISSPLLREEKPWEQDFSKHTSPRGEKPTCLWGQVFSKYTLPVGEEEFYSYPLKGMKCSWGCGNDASSWVRRLGTKNDWHTCCAPPTID